MEGFWKFSAYNTECCYGFGTELEAALWLDFLNKGKELNLFEKEQLEPGKEIKIDDSRIINLTDELQQQ